jgi:spermidine synthase
MAVIWRAERDEVQYEVRSQGKTLRLFANGVQHSEYHPDRLFTGSVWDLLWLPVFFADPTRIRRVLILGLGGGSVVAPLMRFAAPETIVAVDMDPLHLQVAREYFGIERAGVECHCMNATEFVANYRGEPFDLVIEDLFAPHDTTVSRALMPDQSWCQSLSALVSTQGYLVMNFGEWREYRDSWAASDAARKGWAERFRLSTEDCHNAVIVSSRRTVDSATLRRHLLACPVTAGGLRRGELAYQIRRLA